MNDFRLSDFRCELGVNALIGSLAKYLRMPEETVIWAFEQIIIDAQKDQGAYAKNTRYSHVNKVQGTMRIEATLKEYKD